MKEGSPQLKRIIAILAALALLISGAGNLVAGLPVRHANGITMWPDSTAWGVVQVVVGVLLMVSTVRRTSPTR